MGQRDDKTDQILWWLIFYSTNILGLQTLKLMTNLSDSYNNSFTLRIDRLFDKVTGDDDAMNAPCNGPCLGFQVPPAGEDSQVDWRRKKRLSLNLLQFV